MLSSFLLIPLAAYTAVASTAHSISAGPGLTVRTSTPNLNVNGLKNLVVTTTIVNTGGETIKILNGPRGVLDPFPQDSLAITDPSGSRLSFMGARANYNSTYAARLDDPNNFTVLGPGDSIDVTHDASLYDFAHSGGGDYSIKPSNLFTYIDADGTPKDLHATVEGIAKVRLSGDLTISWRVHNKRATFNNCSPEDEDDLKAAIESAHDLVTEAYKYLRRISSGTPRYTAWFGTYRLNFKKAVEHTFEQMTAEDQFTRLSYTCDPACSGAKPEKRHKAKAYRLRGNTRDIFLCRLYWEQFPGVQAMVLVHEVSHFYGNRDYEYGEPAAMKLAKTNPRKAIFNADSAMFFADNIPHLE